MKNPDTEQETNNLNIKHITQRSYLHIRHGLLKISEYSVRFVFVSVSECEMRSFLFCQKHFNTQTERKDLIGGEVMYTA